MTGKTVTYSLFFTLINPQNAEYWPKESIRQILENSESRKKQRDLPILPKPPRMQEETRQISKNRENRKNTQNKKF